jgi:hypothetical protein
MELIRCIGGQDDSSLVPTATLAGALAEGFS